MSASGMAVLAVPWGIQLGVWGLAAGWACDRAVRALALARCAAIVVLGLLVLGSTLPMDVHTGLTLETLRFVAAGLMWAVAPLVWVVALARVRTLGPPATACLLGGLASVVGLLMLLFAVAFMASYGAQPGPLETAVALACLVLGPLALVFGELATPLAWVILPPRASGQRGVG